MAGAERFRQKLVQPKCPSHPLWPGDVDHGPRVGEFTDAPPAAAAWGAKRIAVADHANLDDPPLARLEPSRRSR
jgi:hypothetical protein